MIIGFRARPSNSRYFACMVAVCVFIGYAAAQVASRLSSEPKATVIPPAKSVAHTTAAPISVHVIDGDTIGLNDGRPNVRLVGFNAPETGSRARCDAERQKGEAAGRRLRELVSNGRPDFQQVACSCPPGTEGTAVCNFGRRCGTLRVNGVDVGATLIGEGLAVRFACGATSCPTLPRPWC
jgi:endonuclease YncB( thermonuclease family)